jgi:hypothetical protein
MAKDSLWLRLAVACVSILVALVIAEVALRLFVPVQQERDTEHVYFAYDAALGWLNKPDASGVFRIPSGTTLINISSQGWRDSDPVMPKPAGIKRILVLGDSQTWGYGVNQTERYSDDFRRLLSGVDVLNMGVSGYGTGQEYLLLREHGIAYDPDVVIVGFYSNDLYDNMATNNEDAYSYPRPVLLEQNNTLRVSNVPVPKKAGIWENAPSYYADQSPVIAFLMQHSRLFFMVKQIYAGLQTAMVRMGWREEIPASFKQPDSPQWKATFAILDDMRSYCQARHITLVVAIIPTRTNIQAGDATIDNQLAVWGERSNVPVVRMQDSFASHDLNKLYLAYDSHMSAQGHSLAATLIATKIVDLDIGIVPA